MKSETRLHLRHIEQHPKGKPSGPSAGLSGTESLPPEHMTGDGQVVAEPRPSPRTVRAENHVPELGTEGKAASGRTVRQRQFAGTTVMPDGFSRDQLKKLVRDVDAKHVQTREFDGKRLTYIEGWYAIARANAIFGHAGWDREMVHFERVMERTRSDTIVTCGYMARVRIRVRAGSAEIIREGTGWGSAAASTTTAANERALKGAETDATKRALSTFGASFGLSLYDKDHVALKPRPVFALFAPDEKLLDDALSPEAYATGLRQLIDLCKDTHQLDQLSRHNRASLADLRIQVPTLRNAQGVHFADLLLRLMQRRLEKVRVGNAHATNFSGPGASDSDDEKPGVLARGLDAAARPRPADRARVEAGNQDIVSGSVADTEHYMVPPENRSPRQHPRIIVGQAHAFRRSTGQSAHRRTSYPFPRRSEIAAPNPFGASKDTALPNAETAAREDEPLGQVAVTIEDLACAPVAPPSESARVDQEKGAPRMDGGCPDEASTPTPSTPLTEEMIAATVFPMASPTPIKPSSSPSRIAFGLKIDKSKLLLGLERRIRDKAHLKRVAELPCLVCNRQPSHTHHLRFAQRRGLSQKVSDEYVVPLCALHHGELHHYSSETEWWAKQKIDPLPVAAELWANHRLR